MGKGRAGQVVMGQRFIEWAEKNGHARIVAEARVALLDYKEWRKKNKWEQGLAAKSSETLAGMLSTYEERVRALRDAVIGK